MSTQDRFSSRSGLILAGLGMAVGTGGTGQLIALLVLFGLLACSHDAKQESPLDPELTPTVPLVVALDDTAGAALLSWTPRMGHLPSGGVLLGCD